MKKDAGKIHASIIVPTFIYNYLPYWNLGHSLIIYQECVNDQQMLCGSL